MIKRILVALDGSARAPGVFDAAVEIAVRFGATIVPFRAVVVPPEFPAAAAGSHADPLASHLVEVAEREVARLVAGAPSGAALERPMIRIGQAWRLIVEVSAEVHADLVVIGSHGYHGLDRLLGTTAARVANVARRNVLVVHGHAGPAEHADAGAGPYRRTPR
jgi:nucleotide-binding universal stress UspA family protein